MAFNARVILGLGRSRKLSAGAIPAHLTTLSVSWLNGQAKAVAVHRGAVEGTWEGPPPTAETGGAANFETLLREAVQKTGFRGQTVSMVLAHPRLVQQLVDVPPVKGGALKKVLQRQAQQQKMFPGDAAWTFQTSPSDKPGQSVILHLFPKQLLDHFVQGCKRNGLRLTCVMPASGVMHSQLTELPLEKEETALLAGDTSGSVTVVVGRRDGEILLARTLPGNWNDGAERMAMDLNRTILFINQQYGLNVDSGIWLFGRRTVEQLAALQSQIQLLIKFSPVQFNPFYWATESLKLKPDVSPNLISLEDQMAPQRRTFAKVVAAATVGVMILSVGAAAYSSLAARQERLNIKMLQSQATRLQIQRQALQQRNDELARQQHVVNLVLEERPPPVPLWFLAYLGQATPPELVVTNLIVKRTNDLWVVQLAGTFQTTNNPGPAAMSSALALFKGSLTGPPFHLNLSDLSNQKQIGTAAPTGPAGSAVPEWISRVTSETGKPGATKPSVEDHFLIEGTLR